MKFIPNFVKIRLLEGDRYTEVTTSSALLSLGRKIG